MTNLSAFSGSFFFSRNHTLKLGVRLIHECGLYTSLYGIPYQWALSDKHLLDQLVPCILFHEPARRLQSTDPSHNGTAHAH